MIDPKRLIVLKEICAHLAADVRIANGYQHDLSAAQVSRGRTVFSEREPLPALSLLEAPNVEVVASRSSANLALQTEQWILLLQGWAVDDPANPTDPVHYLLADCKKSLAKIIDPRQRHASFLLGGKITSLTFEPGVVRPADEVSSRAYFWTRITVGLVEDIANPYSI